MTKEYKAVITGLILAIALFVVQAAAQSSGTAKPDQSTSSGSQSPSGAQQQPTNGQREVLKHGTSDLERISREARHELIMLPYYSVFDNLAFEVRPDGTLVLMGQVVRPTLKTDSERRVKDIEGVERVENKIEVLPVSGNDDRLRRDLYRAIYGHASLSRYGWGAVPPIHIIVRNGQVTLEGVVDNESDKTIANIQANSVPGVFKVTNNLRVQKY